MARDGAVGAVGPSERTEAAGIGADGVVRAAGPDAAKRSVGASEAGSPARSVKGEEQDEAGKPGMAADGPFSRAGAF